MKKPSSAPPSRLSSWLIAIVCLAHVACGEESSPAAAPDAAADRTPDAGGELPSASAFCDTYEQTCGFGRESTFSDREDCEDDFADKFGEARRRCAAEHLQRAADDPDAHCEAAKGDDVCR